MRSVDVAGVVDGLHRALRAWTDPVRFEAVRRRGMRADWSWHEPVQRYLAEYVTATARHGRLSVRT